MDRRRVVIVLFWFATGILLAVLVTSLSSCGPTPGPQYVQPVQATSASVQQQAIEESAPSTNCKWVKIANPVESCSARKLACGSALGTYMECVFIRCGTSPVLSCIKR